MSEEKKNKLMMILNNIMNSVITTFHGFVKVSQSKYFPLSDRMELHTF